MKLGSPRLPQVTTRVGSALVIALAVLASGSSPRPNRDAAAAHFEHASTDAGSIGHRRIERTILFTDPWEARCDSRGCSIPKLIGVVASTPESVAAVDVVMWATLDYSISRGDWAEAEAGYVHDGKTSPMTAGPYPLSSLGSSPSLRSTTTLTWAKGVLGAAGKQYEFVVAINPRDGDGDRTVRVSGTKLTLIIEMWPTGP